MKKDFICVLAMLMLGGMLPPVSAQSAPLAAEQHEQVSAPDVEVGGYYSRMEKGLKIQIDFPVPMVDAERVGQPDSGNLWKSNHAEALRSCWVSTSRLELVLIQDLPVMDVFRLEIPEGLSGVNGERISGRTVVLPTSESTYALYSVGCCTNGDIIIRARAEAFNEALRQRVGQIYYELGGDRRVLPVRPATVGDALNHWEAFQMAYRHDLADDLKEEAAEHPVDEQLKDVWVVEAPALSLTNHSIPLMLPQATWDSEKQEYTDEEVEYISLPQFAFSLTNRFQSREQYELELSFDCPAAAVTPEQVLEQFKWSAAPVKGDATSWQPLEWRDGALRCRIQDKDIILTPGNLKTAALRVSDGGVVTGCKSLVLTAQTGGLEIRVHAEGIYEGIVPHFEENTPQNTEDTTVLRPRRPYVYTDVQANHLRMRGSTTIRCRYGRVTGGRIRVWKLDGTGAAAARLLEQYRKFYTGNWMPYWEQLEYRKERKAAGLDDKNPEHNLLSTDSLPGVLSMAERELPAADEGELSLPLTELFPNQPVGGFYMVEVEGKPLRESKMPCVNQGLVQVTDLGLLWKTNGSRLFAWAYRLSTSAAVEEAQLRLLDAEGNTLAELPVNQGLAQGDFPSATRFLQLSAGDDTVTMRYNIREMEEDANLGSSWENKKLREAGIAPSSLPTPLVYLFSDRSLYRPGETAHIKGIMRWVRENQLFLPEVESITAEVAMGYKTVSTLPVEVQPDGSFTLDVPTQTVGDYRVRFNVVYKGDADDSSPDKSVLKALKDDVYLNRSHTIFLPCKEFRRNEFEVESSLSVQEKERTVTVEATAVNFTSTPVADGSVQWSLKTMPGNFFPKQPQWRDFRFGDFLSNPWSFYYAYYYGDEEEHDGEYMSRSGTLDANGKGSVVFALPQSEKPTRLRVVSTATVTNGNEQSIRSVQECTLHPAAVYGGIRPADVLAKVGGSLPVELVAVKPDGSAWDGAPLTAEIRVKRTVFHPYRYGSFFASSVRNAADETVERTIPVSLTGTPQKVEIPVDSAGRYDIELWGKDADGRSFYSSTRHYVWGDEESPWEYLNDSGLNLLADKPLYRPGDTAKVLVQTPVDAELLVTMERGGVLRHFKRTVTVANPVIDVPLETEDAPVVYVSVSLIQNAGNRGADGKPLLKLGTCQLNVEAVDKKLTVQLHAPEKSLLPGDECRVSGVVTDAAGKPVANADVTLYAEDEGTLQVMGYRLPDPLRYFHSEAGREHCVATYSALGQLVSENLGERCFGNKGVFIGGGDCEAEGDEIPDGEADYLRRNFNPCALWLASVRTDAQGRFSAAYTNPDTLTRYRLMAVAAAADKFGSAQSSYRVTKPVMLEPVVPMGAAAGDEILLPVTVSMLPEELEESADASPIRWNVFISGSNVELPQPSQSVSLSGNTPVTIHFPVKVQAPGQVSLRWQVQPESAPQGSMLARCRDAVELSFEAVPPTPFIREQFSYTLAPGAAAGLKDWVRGDYRPDATVELLFSTSPLAGIEYPMQYLFTYPYGCSEQLCSTVLPWVLREQLQSALGVTFPKNRDTVALLSEVDAKLENRRLSSGGYAYWDGGTEASDYSPYVVLVRRLMGNNHWSDNRYLRECVAKDKGNDMFALLVLCMTNSGSEQMVDTVLERVQRRRRALSEQEQWMLALSAALVKHPKAAELRSAAEQCKPSAYDDCHLPPVRALRCLCMLTGESPEPGAAETVRNYVMDEAGLHSTWRSAWMVLTAAMYAECSQQKSIEARLNGEKLTADSPQRYTLRADSFRARFRAADNPVYVYGKAEGYLVNLQSQQAVDKGFAVQRRYECLQPDGSWKPAAVFRVGDVVRVTLTTHATGNHPNRRYMVLEDRLPAAFEVVDPELGSQALPEGIQAEQMHDWWYFGAGVSHREFLKDRVRVFSDNWGNREKMEVSYVARVVRSGTVTAPAAKAELMYRPEVHGLSIPQQFEVKAR